MDEAPPINRLTEREKEALRAWLAHKPAKEIAIDLGITHHAVEKRLKMARVKLGAGSSREAARMLAEAEHGAEQPDEGYQRAVTCAPDLPPPPQSKPSWRHRNLVIGGLAMLTLTALGLALAAAYPASDEAEIEIEGRVERVFAHLDRDKSGYLENPESPFVAVAFVDPNRGPNGGDAREGEGIIGNSDDPTLVSEFYTAADTDHDNRVSLKEYRVWSDARWAELGVEIKTIIKVLPES